MKGARDGAGLAGLSPQPKGGFNSSRRAIWRLGSARPGEEKAFTFKAMAPGLFTYHCAQGIVADHISNGMFGGILVGTAAAFVGEATAFASGFGGDGAALAAYVYSQGPWAALAAGIACFGAWSRFRF